MHSFSITKWIVKRSIPAKFYVIIASVILLLALTVTSFSLAMYTMSGIRAYVGGEGLWSKAQKGAAISLEKYAQSRNESEYAEFQDYLRVPLGDKKARLELEKVNPDLTLARQGFLEGGNHPDDIDGLILLFRNFRHISYLDNAISVWKKADDGIEKFQALGTRLHDEILRYDSAKDSIAKAQSNTTIAALLQENTATDRSLTSLENEFSSVLGEGSRKIGQLLTFIMIALDVLLSIFVMLFGIYIARTVTKVDRAKGEFVALASHQLRTPLTIISWTAEKMKLTGELESIPAARDSVDIISEAAGEMATLISNVLDATRVELGELDLRLKDIDFGAAAENALLAASPLAEAKHIRINQNIAPARAEGDANILQMILQNLLSNAIKYTKSGGEITLNLTHTDKRIKIDVVDTGLGIPASDQPYIFSKLFRAKNAHTADSRGSGLGLYIVKSMVEKTGGRIGFISKEGSGSTFTVAYPRTGMHQKKGLFGIVHNINYSK